MALDAYHRELAKLAATTSSASPSHFPPPLFHPGAPGVPNGLSGAQDLTMPKRLSPLDTKDNDDKVKILNMQQQLVSMRQIVISTMVIIFLVEMHCDPILNHMHFVLLFSWWLFSSGLAFLLLRLTKTTQMR